MLSPSVLPLLLFQTMHMRQSAFAWVFLCMVAVHCAHGSKIGIDFCQECHVFGESPLCMRNCSECDVRKEYCIPDVECGPSLGTTWSLQWNACLHVQKKNLCSL